MSFTGFLFAFALALSTFHVNQRIAKMTNVKILINSLFDIYGHESFDDFDGKEVATRLMNEIINIEKINDNNYYINLELKRVKKLRLVYYHFKDKNTATEEIKKIGFVSLNKSFIVLAFLDISLPRLTHII
jgi:hypothetical protein|tara:strand:- start:1682 stop:2074 length:393 start_codon:yes stop_codon:yes gene_type:complete